HDVALGRAQERLLRIHDIRTYGFFGQVCKATERLRSAYTGERLNGGCGELGDSIPQHVDLNGHDARMEKWALDICGNVQLAIGADNYPSVNCNRDVPLMPKELHELRKAFPGYEPPVPGSP